MPYIKPEGYQNKVHREWKELTKKQVIKEGTKRALGVAALVGTLYAFTPYSPMDLAGDSVRPYDDEDIALIYGDKNKSLGYRFAMQYLGTRNLDRGVDGSGIIGHMNQPGSAGLVGDDCLASTVYDTRPSEIRITGLSKGGGDISAIASTDSTNDGNTLIVYPGNSGRELRFDLNEYGVLIPTDSTSNVLSTYTCSLVGVVPEYMLSRESDKSQ